VRQGEQRSCLVDRDLPALVVTSFVCRIKADDAVVVFLGAQIGVVELVDHLVLVG